MILGEICIFQYFSWANRHTVSDNKRQARLTVSDNKRQGARFYSVKIIDEAVVNGFKKISVEGNYYI